MNMGRKLTWMITKPTHIHASNMRVAHRSIRHGPPSSCRIAKIQATSLKISPLYPHPHCYIDSIATNISWISGWLFQPLWKIWKSVGMIYSQYIEKKMFQTTNQLTYLEYVLPLFISRTYLEKKRRARHAGARPGRCAPSIIARQKRASVRLAEVKFASPGEADWEAQVCGSNYGFEAIPKKVEK